MSIAIHKKDNFAFVVVLCHNSMLPKASTHTHIARTNVIKIKYCFYYYRDGLKDLQGISPTHANEDFSPKMLKFKYFI